MERKMGTTMLGANTIGNLKMKMKHGSFIKWLIKRNIGKSMIAGPMRFHTIRKRLLMAFRSSSQPTMRAEIPYGCDFSLDPFYYSAQCSDAQSLKKDQPMPRSVGCYTTQPVSQISG
jgi:hypothetical protein